MTVQDPKSCNNKDILNGLEAMQRAAEMARDLAIQTGTSIVMMRDQQIVHVSAEELLKERQLQSAKKSADPLP